jgi:feruloyl esterase
MGRVNSKPLACAMLLATIVAAGHQHAAAATCESLTRLKLPHASILSAEANTSGSFTPPPGGIAMPGAPKAFAGLPAFCRVTVKSTPGADSLINIEVWVPLGKAWNGKYQQIGCGGYCGYIGHANLASAIKRGYAAAATDDGSQTSAQGNFALGHPEKIIDFGYRALKETTDNAKAVITALGGRKPQRAYFNGCSDGGREALMEAQRFPRDFDGIIVGAPANDWTHIFGGFLANSKALLDDPASYVPATKLVLLSKAALAQCGTHDGGAPGDPFLNDPLQCKFDPVTVQCRADQDLGTCLTAPQVTAVSSIYNGPRDLRTGKSIAPGFEPGNEADASNWPIWMTGVSREANLSKAPDAQSFVMPRQAMQANFANSFLSFFVYQKPTVDIHMIDVAQAVADADARVGKIINSADPDLRHFQRRGGKLIQYHGWVDAALPPRNSVNYYNDVRTVLNGKSIPDTDARSFEAIQSFYRLFMVPGMGHCASGSGATEFGQSINAGPDADHDIVMALERWVEHGVAPDKIIATHYVDGDPAKGPQFQRPLCPYPQVAHYDGHGNPAVADSFKCQ